MRFATAIAVIVLWWCIVDLNARLDRLEKRVEQRAAALANNK